MNFLDKHPAPGVAVLKERNQELQMLVEELLAELKRLVNHLSSWNPPFGPLPIVESSVELISRIEGGNGQSCAIEDCERPAQPGKNLCESCAAGCAPGEVKPE